MSAPALQAESWQLLSLLDQAPGLRVLADTLADMADEGQPVVACTADLKYSNGLVRFEQRHPDRFVQFGISEQNMVSAAAGMAAAGMRPYVATFASFLALLCCEQIRTDCAYTGLPVRLIGHHAGITLGFYGTSHHATEDLAIMRSLAGIDVVAPADPATLAAAIRAYADHVGPVYFRVGRGREPAVYAPGELRFERGRAIVHERGSELTVIATGSMVHPALGAVTELRASGLDVGLIDMHTIKPLDREAVVAAASTSARVMTVEEHSIVGGLGGAVGEVLAEIGSSATLHRHGIPDVYAPVGPPTHLYRHYRLDAAGIAAEARELLAG
jgi:transketolase